MTDRPGLLQVTLAPAEGRNVICVRGEVDLHTSPRLRLLLLEYAEKVEGPVLVDLSAVGYMDSSGVGTMVYVKREIERANRRFVLINPQARVRGVFEITHLDKFFTIAASAAEASTE